MYGNSASLAPVNIFTPSGLMNLGYDSLSPMHALWLLDPDTRTHSYRVAHIAEKMGTGLGLDGTTIDDLKKAGLLHDVGKIAVQSIVLKLGKLTVEEQDGIIWHPIYSGIILSKNPRFSTPPITRAAEEHHERNDGGGYPLGKKGDEISLGGKILSICDGFEAATSRIPMRNYNHLRSGDGHPLTVDDFGQVVMADNGKEYDPEIAGVFIERVLGDREFLRTLCLDV